MKIAERSDEMSPREPVGASERKWAAAGSWMARKPVSAVRSSGTDMHRTVDEEWSEVRRECLCVSGVI
jgi:hypothetical protein